MIVAQNFKDFSIVMIPVKGCDDIRFLELRRGFVGRPDTFLSEGYRF